MPYFYSNPDRESDPHALPNVEVWESPVYEYTCECGFEACEGVYALQSWEPVSFACPGCSHVMKDAEATQGLDGFFYWFCFPGCLPENDPIGPFDSEADALADAREGLDY